MTTYLLTMGLPSPVSSEEERTSTFCSRSCRAIFARGLCDFQFDSATLDERYEFDETCATCGQLIPAAPSAFVRAWS